MIAGMLTRSDPAVRRTLARLRAVRMAMRREGKLAAQGRPLTPAAKTDVRESWRRAGWKRPVRKAAR